MMSSLSTPLTLLLVLAMVMPAAFAEGADGGSSVAIQVWVIRATKSNDEISKELKPLAEKLKRQLKYTGFKLEKKASGEAKIGSAYSTPLLEKYSARVTPKKIEGKRVQLRVQVFEKKKDRNEERFEVTITTTRGEFQLFGGWPLANKDALIIAVSGR
jgi:hypothetical protein